MATATVEEIKSALTSHVVPVRADIPNVVTVTKPKTTTKRKSKKITPCPYCSFTAKSKSGQEIHNVECVLNPKKELRGYVTPCSNCGVEISNRGLSKHLLACDGNPDHTWKRIKDREKWSRQRAIALRDGVARRTTVKTTPAPMPKSKTESSDLGAFISMMEDHLQNSNVSFREFNQWKEMTTKLW